MLKGLKKLGVQKETLDCIHARELPFINEMIDLVYSVAIGRSVSWERKNRVAGDFPPPDDLLHLLYNTLTGTPIVSDDPWKEMFPDPLDRDRCGVVAFYLAAHIGFKFLEEHCYGWNQADWDNLARWPEISELRRESKFCQRYGVNFEHQDTLDAIADKLGKFRCLNIGCSTIEKWIEDFLSTQFPELIRETEKTNRHRTLLPGLPKKLETGEELSLLSSLKRSEQRLTAVMDALGAIEKAKSDSTKKKEVKTTSSQGICYGDELSEVFVSEFAQHPILFGAAFAEQRLLQTRYSTMPADAGGDVFVFLDISGSMDWNVKYDGGDNVSLYSDVLRSEKPPASNRAVETMGKRVPNRIEWAIAVILKLWEICCVGQGKTLYVIPYDNFAREPLMFSRKRNPYREELLNIKTTGSTNFTAPVSKAFDLIEGDREAKLKELDFLFLTDASGFKEIEMKEFYPKKKKYRTKVAAVLIAKVGDESREQLENSQFVDNSLFLMDEPKKMAEKLSDLINQYK